MIIIETKRIKNLEAYLKVGGLEDYNLTDVERDVLEDFESGKIKFHKFKLGYLFEINLTKYYPLKHK
ncbi:hypothetical protein MNB_ARC-1_91 [hydrothermal vent metagenome]|uniref:Uncharacterized protein n=1 Tax=hydrothermal vent metagenome TaxID=652676 RepID=A0A3B1E7F2_9ZZZZ